MSCSHNWRLLYEKPTDPKFLELYGRCNLETWWQCDRCQFLGRTQTSGKIKTEPIAKKKRRLIDVEKWNDSLRIWASIKE